MLAAALFMTLSQLTTHAAQTERYLIDSNGNVVTSPTAGVCVQTSEWKPGTGVPPCDPEAAKRAAAPVAPKPALAPEPAPAPRPVVAQAAPAQKISFAADVLFDFNSANLKPGAREKLAKLAGVLLAYPGLQISLEGHTDSIGSDQSNQGLSERRADSVRPYLLSSGIKPDLVRAMGFGGRQPVVSNAASRRR